MKDNKNEQIEFINKFKHEKKMYQAWGDYVVNVIKREIIKKDINLDEIIKIPVIPRVKKEESLIEKAFFRKRYKNPYEEITDKVGVRFVVLVEEHIQIIKNIIESLDVWTHSEDVDYKKDVEKNPDLFVYQSVHYIVRNKDNIINNGENIIKNTPCEIQIRTLEQHAYAEISHDTVYKKSIVIDSKIKRMLSRSMALNETTDELFGKVYSMIGERKRMYNEFNALFKKYYAFSEMSEKINKSIYDSIENFIYNHKIKVEQVNAFLEEKKFIIENVKEKEPLNLLYKQPMVYLLYYLAKNYPEELKEEWFMTEDVLEMIYIDIGYSF